MAIKLKLKGKFSRPAVESVNGVKPDETGEITLPIPECKIKSVNNIEPDKSGNITIEFPKQEQVIGKAGTAGYAEFFNSPNNIASGYCAHAEGDSTTASARASHAEGFHTTASGSNSHAEGSATVASGLHSHAEGAGTHAVGNHQHVQGRYNVKDTSNTYAHIVGNGTFGRPSNAHTLDWSGNAWYQGSLRLGGASYDDASEVALKSDIPQFTSDDAFDLLMETGVIEPLADSNGVIYTDTNGSIYTL